MRRFVLAVLASVAVLGVSGCEREERPGFFEPAFGKATAPPNPCPDVIGIVDPDDKHTSKYEIVGGLYAGIDALFQDARSRNGAKSHVDNIVREVCEGDYASAQDFLHNLIQQIENQPDEFLSQDKPHVADLVDWARVLATDLGTTLLPEGALGFDGGLMVSSGGTGAPLAKTRNGHVIVNAADFPAGAPFVIAIAPKQGDFGDYVVYGTDSYDITTGSDPAEGSSVLVVFCGSYPGELRIAHQKGDATVELLEEDVVPEGFCSEGAATSSALLKRAPGWLRSLAGTMRNVFGPTPVYARAETGLGGRTKSFSPFAVVDEPPLIEYASSVIREYDQANDYLFNWKAPTLAVTGTGDCKNLGTGYSLAAYDVTTTKATLGPTCPMGGTTLAQFSVTVPAGATPPLKANAEVTYPTAKTYASNTVDVPPVYATLEVALGGTGAGSVTSSVGGIACPTTKCEATFQDWQDVILSATPDAYSEWQSWTAANETGEAVSCYALSGDRCGIRVRQNRTVTASFKKVKAPLTITCQSRLVGSIVVSYAGQELCAAGKDVVSRTVNPVLFGVAVTVTAQTNDFNARHDIWFSSPDLTLGAECPAKVRLNPKGVASCQLTLPATGGQLDVKLTDS